MSAYRTRLADAWNDAAGTPGGLSALLSRVEGIDAEVADAPKNALQIVVGEATYALPVGEVIDLIQGKERVWTGCRGVATLH